MFTQFLGTAATVYGVLAALKRLRQTRQLQTRPGAMVHRHGARSEPLKPMGADMFFQPSLA